MRILCTHAMVLVALTVPLGACSSFFGVKFARHTSPTVTQPAQADAAPSSPDLAPAIAEGRKYLAADDIGLAIEAFQRALGAGESIASAVNGMGIAYARLGRHDLAQRFFEQAMSADPQNVRYAENMARLKRSIELAMRHDADVASEAAKLAEQASETTIRAAPVSPLLGKLQRVSREEVRLEMVGPQAAPIKARATDIDRRFKPLVRFALADTKPQAFLRFVLPTAQPNKNVPK